MSGGSADSRKSLALAAGAALSLGWPGGMRPGPHPDPGASAQNFLVQEREELPRTWRPRRPRAREAHDGGRGPPRLHAAELERARTRRSRALTRWRRRPRRRSSGLTPRRRTRRARKDAAREPEQLPAAWESRAQALKESRGANCAPVPNAPSWNLTPPGRADQSTPGHGNGGRPGRRHDGGAPVTL